MSDRDNELDRDDPSIPGRQYLPDPEAQERVNQSQESNAIDPALPIDPLDKGDEAKPQELPDELAMSGPGAQETASPKRRYGLMIGAVASLVVIVLGVFGVLWLLRNASDSTAPVPVTTAAATDEVTPTSTSGSYVPEDSPVYDVLARQVAGFTMVSAKELPDMTKDGAAIAYETEYTNGTDKVTVIVGRWDADKDAKAWADTTAKQFSKETLQDSGAVDGDGSFWQYKTQAGQEIIWTKGNTSMAMIGPDGATQSFYTNYPF